MINYAILEAFEEMELNTSFDELIHLHFGLMCHSSTSTSPFQNHVLVNKVLSESQIQEIETISKGKHRNSAIFFENRDDLKPLAAKLLQRGYTKEWEDSWMFYEQPDVSQDKFDCIIEVQTARQLDEFLQTFDESFQPDDPQNPYGDVKDFLLETRKAWFKFATSKRVQYFTAYSEGKPVAVSALNNYKGLGYISCVGSVRSVRGKGFGKAITLFAVNQSKKNHNQLHFLATEEGTYPNSFYSRIGFSTRFRAPGFTKTLV